jgi:hypothetical protein
MQHCEPTTPRPHRRGMTRRSRGRLNTVCFVRCQSGSFRGHVYRLVVRRSMSASSESSEAIGIAIARTGLAENASGSSTSIVRREVDP